MLLWDRDHRPQSELVDALGVEAPTITKMLQRLEQQEIVTRQRPPANRRTVVVSLTATGRKLHHDVQRIWTELEESTTRSLTAPDKRTLARIFQHLERDLAAAQGGISDPDLAEGER